MYIYILLRALICKQMMPLYSTGYSLGRVNKSSGGGTRRQ